MPYADPEKRRAYQKAYGYAYYHKHTWNALRGTEESRKRLSEAQKRRYAKNPKQKSMPVCHPDKKYHAGGYCSECYWVKIQKPSVEGRRFLAKYGIVKAQAEEAKMKQDGRCALCKNIPKLWHTDHNHQTGKFRGMLCSSCNTMLGSYERMKKIPGIEDYLRSQGL